MSKPNIPRYTSIAIDIAHNILNDTYAVGEKIKGRSTLSSKYSVSPETIRKSIFLLRDMDVVEVNEKSGIVIKSKDMAYMFIEKYDTQININLLHQKILDLQKQKNELELQINLHLNTILEYTLKYERTLSLNAPEDLSDHIDTIKLTLSEEDFVIGKSISETQFFKYTHATIVSITKQNERILSPGPFHVFQPNDILNIVCDETHIEVAKSFIKFGPHTCN
ncbi:GntR family transcriptional regulator [Niameybacter massiliensis]|uniref:GntR family transcriptional regulator n=1 Tax=Holtiella tumoricola TaxID=3018743 RepID=A0AA42J059_9FIRM|nr:MULTISPECIES: TrkA C-terminal domain-containing protein [Lachnospirales]MDA3730906.1 GntR family transcriptional regulator [Holtiella tumoricola]